MFVAVYEELSFTAAAAREHATQSGVSQHIRNLEDRMGVQLLARQKGVVQPTPAGNAYYLRCIDVLKAHAQAKRTLEEFSSGLSGELAAGVMPSMARSLLAPAVLQFGEANPNVKVRVVDAYSHTLTNALRAGELDFAIVPRTPAPAVGIKSTLFTRTPEFLISSPASDLSHGVPVRLADLPDMKLIVPGAANARRARLESYFDENGIRPKSLLEFDSLLGTMDMVARSEWKTIMPGIFVATDVESRHFIVNPIVSPAFSLDLMLIVPERQPLSAAALAFLDCLRLVTEQGNRVAIQLAEG